ncbi:MAG TPA: CHAP domain-containing protein [Chloroflexota bacterium]
MAFSIVAGSFMAGAEPSASNAAAPPVFDEQQRAAIVARAIPFTQRSEPPAPELILPESPPTPALARPAPELKEYVVADGDNPFDLAQAFNISEETLLAANGLNADSVLQIGQRLLVPPVNGVVVSTQPGDTVGGIVNQWKLDLGLFTGVNKLLDGSDALLAGEALVLPNAAPPVQIYPLSDAPDTDTNAEAPPAKQDSQIVKPFAAAPKATNAPTPPPLPPITRPAVRASGPNYFPYGQCTWWAAQSRPDIGSRVFGNASAWAYSARAAGLPVGTRPAVGAVVVYQPGAQGAAWTGHVAYVTSVAPDGMSFTISEMNFPYWGRVTRRASWAGPGVSFIY